MNQDHKLRKTLRALKTDHFARTGTHGILIPSFKEVEREFVMPNVFVSGHFRLVARSARYKGERVLADFPNLILDSGLKRIASNLDSRGFVQLGTGTTAPAAGQTTLVNKTASINSSGPGGGTSYVAGPPAYSQIILNYRSAIGGATGTFSEIGIGWADTGNLLSRALILDGGGSPTTITVLGDEALDVFYTFRRYSMPADVTGTTVISGSSYDWTLRAADENAQAANYMLQGCWGTPAARGYGSDAVLAPITSSPSSATSTGLTGMTVNYTAGNTYSDASVAFGLTSNPSGGVKAASVGIAHVNSGLARGGLQQVFTPAIPKNGTNILTLSYRQTLARYP